MSDVSLPTSTTQRNKGITTVHFGDTYCSSEVHTMRCVFHDFKGLPHNAGDFVFSKQTRIHGHLWFLMLYPGGRANSSEGENHTAVYLHMKPDKKDQEVLASYQFRVPNVQGSKRGNHNKKKKYFNRSGYGFSKFLLREDALDSNKNYLKHGALTVEVDIKVWTKNHKRWSPPVDSTFQNDMMHALETSKFADVTFVVQGKKFPVHRVVVASRAPFLASLFEDEPPNSEIDLRDNIDPFIFEILLRFMYGHGLPPAADLKDQDQARALLYAANYCGLTTPKLAAESILVESVASDTAAELLTLADANACALLKEAAIDFFVANPAAVRASSGWAVVKESKDLMDELLEATYTGKRDPSEKVDVDRMCVATLRRKLGKRGLDVDGSRASLVKHLKGEQAD